MDQQVGLRERKRQRTHDTISAAAISLFLERGFDRVSVADVAAAAEVSKPTLFKYFASKEDLVLHRIVDHQGETARVVRRRPAGESPLAALRRHFVAGLQRRDPVTGLNDNAEVLAYHRMVFDTPSLSARLFQHMARDEEALAEAFTEATRSMPAGTPAASGRMVDALDARLAASQVLAAQRVLARENWRRLATGGHIDEVFPEAVEAANQAFGLLADGPARRYAT